MRIEGPYESGRSEALALATPPGHGEVLAIPPSSASFPGAPTPLGGLKKRGLDIALAGLALLVLLPLFGLIAALIKLSDGGPVLYRHARLGHGKRPFSCLKFRTMVVESDEILRRHLQSCQEARCQWQSLQKLKEDPRVTPVGRVLRKLSIDELPQVINVLRGEMSLVGPRPIIQEEISRYGTDCTFYFQARPGLTGAWQVSGRNDTSYEERVRLDRTYVENWSLWADLVIITKTVPAILLARGTY